MSRRAVVADRDQGERLPLQGIRVLDLSQRLPGPYASLVLADLGADVVKMEPPAGDPLRWLAPLAHSQSGAFHALNRNKRSVVVNLKAADGAAVLLRLVRSFDVLVESFRPGVLHRLGVGHGALRAENTRLVICAITGYGQTGPYRHLAGHDINYCAISGALSLNGPSEAPLPFGVQLADVAGGAWVAVAGILAALHRRSATGQGALVDVSMTEGAMGMLAMHLGMAVSRGSPLGRGQAPLAGGAACYRIYRTRDGRFVALGALEPQFFARFCIAAGRPELSPRHLENDGRGPVEELEALFATRSRDEWEDLGRKHDLCLTPVLEGDEPREDPHLKARGVFSSVPTPWEGRDIFALATPVRMDGMRSSWRAAPELGADTETVLGEAGFTQREIAALRKRKVAGVAD